MGFRAQVIPSRWYELIHRYADRNTGYDVSPHLICAVISIESQWNPHAISRMNINEYGQYNGRAHGLCQILPMHYPIRLPWPKATQAEAELSDYERGLMLDPNWNIRKGAELLRYASERSVEACGFVDPALAWAYYYWPGGSRQCNLDWLDLGLQAVAVEVREHELHYRMVRRAEPGVWVRPNDSFYADVTWRNEGTTPITALVTVAYGRNPITTPPYLDGIGVTWAVSVDNVPPGQTVTRVGLTVPTGSAVGDLWSGVAVIHILYNGGWEQVAQAVSPEHLYVSDTLPPWEGKL